MIIFFIADVVSYKADEPHSLLMSEINVLIALIIAITAFHHINIRIKNFTRYFLDHTDISR